MGRQDCNFDEMEDVTPATVVEMTLGTSSFDLHFYNISLVDGFNFLGFMKPIVAGVGCGTAESTSVFVAMQSAVVAQGVILSFEKCKPGQEVQIIKIRMLEEENINLVDKLCDQQLRIAKVLCGDYYSRDFRSINGEDEVGDMITQFPFCVRIKGPKTMKGVGYVHINVYNGVDSIGNTVNCNIQIICDYVLKR